VSITFVLVHSRGKSSGHPLARGMYEPQSQSWQHGEVKIPDPTGARTPAPGRQARIQSLYRIHILDVYYDPTKALYMKAL
jgi:hypothetical protein